MKITLWAKKGTVVISVFPDTKQGTAPAVTMEMKDPQIIYDEGSGKVSIVETK